MPATKALIFYLAEIDQPVISVYQLAIFMYKVYKEKKYGEIPIKSKASALNKEIFNRNVKRFRLNGFLTPHPSFGGNQVYSILGKKGFEASDIACAIDPFAYMSHLSAMAYHGLTDRVPSTLFISSPNSSMWTEFARQKMVKDLGDEFQEYINQGLPKLRRITMSKIAKIPVHIHTSLHLGAYKIVKGRSLRVSTIGRTFLDMVREPALCGGMRHCIDVFREYGRQNSVLIIDELTRYGNQIEKSRVGYLLEEVCKIHNEKLDEWARHVQRGGSRKLDPTNEYEPTYSERWCISLNVPDLEKSDADM